LYKVGFLVDSFRAMW